MKACTEARQKCVLAETLAPRNLETLDKITFFKMIVVIYKLYKKQKDCGLSVIRQLKRIFISVDKLSMITDQKHLIKDI
jgi:hypothetical protein